MSYEITIIFLMELEAKLALKLIELDKKELDKIFFVEIKKKENILYKTCFDVKS